jgi:putative ABC transport system ATP-binding protein
MESGIFQFILRHSRRDQLILVALSLAALPFLYLSFELPKIIVNEALPAAGDFPRQQWGLVLDQVPYLLSLCGIFLVVVLVNAAFKFFTSTYRYRVGDRLLRRLRYQLVERLLRFPVGRFRNQPSGQVVSMVAAETSPLGFFMSEAFSVPTVAAGTMLTVLLFIFMQDWLMGLAALALYPLQIRLIPQLQRRINALQQRESLAIRGVSDNVSQIIVNAADIHGHDTAQLELARVTGRLQTIFDLRLRIARSRYTINVLNQLFSQLTPFLFLSIGGYLVIEGDISLGSLVAVLAAHKDLYSPWKDLIDYYQKAEDARVKYGQLREYFDPASLMERSIIAADPPPIRLADTPLVLSNVVVETEDGVKAVDGVSLRLELPLHAAFIGGTGDMRTELARLLLRQASPTSGDLTVDSQPLRELPDSVIGRRIGYAGTDLHFSGGSLRDVLTYPLRRRPGAQQPFDGMDEARLTGNSTFDPDADWVDYAAAGCRQPADLDANLIKTLRLADLADDAYDWGMRRPVQGLSADEVIGILHARVALAERLRDAHLADAVERFDRSRFMEGSSLAENIIFGAISSRQDAAVRAQLEDHLLQTLRACSLDRQLAATGHTVALLMIEMFRNFDPGNEFLQGFNLIRTDELADYELLVRRVGAVGIDAIDDEQLLPLIRLALQLVATRHTLGVIDDTLRHGMLQARARFRDRLPTELQGSIAFFDAQAINPAGSLHDNLLFGTILTSRAESRAAISAVLRETVQGSGLLPLALRLGLLFDVGMNGAFLTASQRARLVLARALVKRPDILVMNDALIAVEPHRQARVFAAVREHMRERSVLLIDGSEQYAAGMHRVFELTNGRIVERKADRAQFESQEDTPVDTGDLGGAVEIMARIPLFAGIDRAKLKLLAFTSEKVEFAPGDTVFHQGDAGDRAYVVLEGSVDVIVESTTGESTTCESTVATIGRHQLFGEMALLANQPRTTTIRAATPTQLLAMRQDVFVRLVKEDAGIALGITRVLIERLASTLRGVRPQ